MGVVGMAVGLSLCWVVCCHGDALFFVWVSIWVVLRVRETSFHHKA